MLFAFACYCRMLAVEDNIKSHKFFGLAAKAAIECYLHLVDHPVQDEEQKKDEATGAYPSLSLAVYWGQWLMPVYERYSKIWVHSCINLCSLCYSVVHLPALGVVWALSSAYYCQMMGLLAT